MAIFQTGIILFFISIGAKNEAKVPILSKFVAENPPAIIVNDYANPLTQILMLTAKGSGCAFVGGGLGLDQNLFQQH